MATKRASPRGRSLALDIAGLARDVAESYAGREWPSAKWQCDPVGFANFILGVRLWSAEVEILEAIRDGDRVAVAGGRKIGKDFTLAVAALWYFASFPGARVFMTATTAKQVDGILYREIRQRYALSGKCADCRDLEREQRKRGQPIEPPPCRHSAMLSGRLGELARTGLVAPDLREIKGYTADDAEGLAGMSGANILAIIDEASGYKDHLHAAIRGNLAAAGCKEVLISNPTKNKGFFFDAFHSRRDSYRCIQVSSESTPNVLEGRDVFPGLASRSWLQTQADDWGKESALYAIHCKGQFVLNEQGAIFPVHAIAEAEALWHDQKPEGPLFVGVDPAGEGGKGDESAFAPRRGKKAFPITARRGLSPSGHLIEVLGLLATYGGGERACVVIDREGETGAKVYGEFVSHLQAHPDAFDLIGVRSSERAHRKPLVYDRVRDELCAVLADWFRDGGTIAQDSKLSKDLQAFRWTEHVSGRTKAIPKDKIREELGRSPDRADALALSCWKSVAVGATADTPATEKAPQGVYEHQAEQTFDPYAALDTWK